MAYCNALNGKPAAQVDWILPPTIDLGDVRNETTVLTDNNNYKTMMTKSVLRLVPRKRYNGLLATCQVTHPTLIKPVYYTLNISVECKYTCFQDITISRMKSNLTYMKLKTLS